MLSLDGGSEEGPSDRYESLDAWRGVACLMVIVFHSTFYIATLENERAFVQNPTVSNALAAIAARLWVAVPIFFVISGYCIASSADRLIKNKEHVGAYFAKRFRRIFPPYWICLALSIIFVESVGYVRVDLLVDGNHGFILPEMIPVCDWPGNILLTEGWSRHVFSTKGNLFLGHAWTLCYEEQFYCVVGLAIAINRRHLFATLFLITFAVLVLAIVGPSSRMFGFFYDGRWLVFAAGVAVYWNEKYANKWLRYCVPVALLSACGLACAEPILLLDFYGNAQQERAVACAFALLIILLRKTDSNIVKCTMAYPLIACGRMCYSVYLVHYPITKIVSHGFVLMGLTGVWQTLLISVPVSIGLSLFAGYVFFVCVERAWCSGARLRHQALA